MHPVIRAVMQTFLPYVDFKKSATVLDRQRLGKQRVEAYQILRITTGLDPHSRWRNHPAVKMWQGYSPALLHYAFEVVFEWRRRGYNDSMAELLNGTFCWLNAEKVVRPHWLGDQQFHGSHRAALLAKLPEHYTQFRWKEEPKIEYYWPAPAELNLYRGDNQ